MRSEYCNSWYHGGIEVLTQSGFRSIANVKKSDLIAFVRYGKTIFASPSYIERSEREFECIGIYKTGKASTLLGELPVSSGVLIGKKVDVDFVLPIYIKLQEMKHSYLSRFYCAAEVQYGAVNELCLLDRFHIAVQADGTTDKLSTGQYGTSFSFSKIAKIERLEDICADIRKKYGGLSYTGNEDERTVRFRIRTTFEVYKRFASWVTLSDKSSHWCKMFIDELSYWDSNVVDQTTIVYSNTCKGDIDYVQSIACIAGFATRMNKRESTGVYNLSIYKHKQVLGSQLELGDRSTKDGIWTRLAQESSDGIILRMSDFIFIGSC